MVPASDLAAISEVIIPGLVFYSASARAVFSISPSNE